MMIFFRRLGLLLMGFLIAFLAGEGVLRLYLALAPTPADSPYVPDRYAVYRLRPPPPGSWPEGSTDHINSFGFRDREHPLTKPPRTYRVIGIGDSFVYGNVPLDDNFLRVTEARLSDYLGPRSYTAEMILMGLGGYTPANETGILRSLALELDPDLVVLNFFTGNDVTGLAMPGELIRGRLYYVGSPTRWLHFLRKSRIFLLAEHTFLHRIKGRAIERSMEEMQRGAAEARGAAGTRAPEPEMEEAWDAPTPERETDEALDAPTPERETEEASDAPTPKRDTSEDARVTDLYLRYQTKRLPTFLKNPDRRMRGLWAEAEKNILEFDRLCTEAGVPWILLIVPSEIQVDPDVRAQVLSRLSLSPDLYDFDAPQRRLTAFAEEHGIVVLDPLPQLRRAHDPRDRLYIPNDTHWSIRGNRVVGEMLADFVAENYLEEVR